MRRPPHQGQPPWPRQERGTRRWYWHPLARQPREAAGEIAAGPKVLQRELHEPRQAPPRHLERVEELGESCRDELAQLCAQMVRTVAAGLAPPAPPVAWLRVPLPSLLALASRSLMARPLRLAGTMFTLALDGAILMTAVNANASLVRVVEGQMRSRVDDIEVRLQRPASRGDLETLDQVEGVVASAPWGLALVSLVRADGTATERFGLQGPPVDHPGPALVEGDWVERDGEVVANRVLMARYPWLGVGTELTLGSMGGDRTARIVGTIEEVAEPSLYGSANLASSLAGARGDHFAGLRLDVASDADPIASANAVEQSLVDRGLFPLMAMPRSMLSEAMTEHFGILTAVLTLLAIGGTAVGGLSLSTTLSLTAMEHRREIAVVKAIGETRRTIFRWVFLEGGTVALGAGPGSVLLSLPLSIIVVRMLGEHGLHVHVPVVIASRGLAAGTVLLVVVTLAATWLPARSAARGTVQDAIRSE